MTPNATVIVARFLERNGHPEFWEFRGQPGLYLPDGSLINWPWLTRWVWEEFQEAPTQAAIKTAHATLRALATEMDRA